MHAGRVRGPLGKGDGVALRLHLPLHKLEKGQQGLQRPYNAVPHRTQAIPHARARASRPTGLQIIPAWDPWGTAWGSSSQTPQREHGWMRRETGGAVWIDGSGTAHHLISAS
ncbi:hypothetical protein MRB53_041606 [Persea americana]|nr:hypothetical protein MRB53_041606 [Persea americana]